jgi:hypothetical protein
MPLEMYRDLWIFEGRIGALSLLIFWQSNLATSINPHASLNRKSLWVIGWSAILLIMKALIIVVSRIQKKRGTHVRREVS